MYIEHKIRQNTKKARKKFLYQDDEQGKIITAPKNLEKFIQLWFATRSQIFLNCIVGITNLYWLYLNSFFLLGFGCLILGTAVSLFIRKINELNTKLNQEYEAERNKHTEAYLDLNKAESLSLNVLIKFVTKSYPAVYQWCKKRNLIETIRHCSSEFIKIMVDKSGIEMLIVAIYFISHGTTPIGPAMQIAYCCLKVFQAVLTKDVKNAKQDADMSAILAPFSKLLQKFKFSNQLMPEKAYPKGQGMQEIKEKLDQDMQEYEQSIHYPGKISSKEPHQEKNDGFFTTKPRKGEPESKQTVPAQQQERYLDNYEERQGYLKFIQAKHDTLTTQKSPLSRLQLWKTESPPPLDKEAPTNELKGQETDNQHERASLIQA